MSKKDEYLDVHDSGVQFVEACKAYLEKTLRNKAEYYEKRIAEASGEDLFFLELQQKQNAQVMFELEAHIMGWLDWLAHGKRFGNRDLERMRAVANEIAAQKSVEKWIRLNHLFWLYDEINQAMEA